jgi:5-(carboxyamino)imidazole ribonucleotide synthase
MLGLAGIPLNVECRFLGVSPDSPAAAVGTVIVGRLDDPQRLAELAKDVDVVTPEIENVSVEALRSVTATTAVHPAADMLAAAQDRVAEKVLLREVGIATADFVPVQRADDLAAAPESLGWPIMLKARRLGYDGRGQRLCESIAEMREAWESLGEVPSIAEAFIDFGREVSLIAVRGADGEEEFYPLSENAHADGILTTAVAPFVDSELASRARSCLSVLMRKFDYRGVLTVEFFHTAEGLIANEIAPRVHNSGHWTIEGAETSQFENHLRAITGLPLGTTGLRGHAAMLNIIGVFPQRERLLRVPGLHLHDYDKTPRPGRKLGHCTLVDSDRQHLLERMEIVKRLLNDPHL